MELVLNQIRLGLLQVQQFAIFTWRCLVQTVRGRRYVADTLYQMDKIGVGSIFIVGLTGLFTGMVFALQTGTSLQRFGVAHNVGKVISLSIIKELGPVLTALVTAGRAGSGIAAQLSSMVVTEQIDAIEAEGLDPIKRVVVPRVIACFVMLPILTILANAIALIGGSVISESILGVAPTMYWNDVFDVLTKNDILMGSVKPVASGIIIGITSSFFGLSCDRDARGVGNATNLAVVWSTILIIACDFLITKVIIFLD